MYISNLKLRNWRNFTSVDVDLKETVYLIGPNASGKSNLIDIFRFMRDIVNPKGGGLQLRGSDMTDVYCFAFVEDTPSAAVADKLVAARNARLERRLVFREGFPAVMEGFGAIKNKCRTFLNMAKTGSHTFVLKGTLP